MDAEICNGVLIVSAENETEVYAIKQYLKHENNQVGFRDGRFIGVNLIDYRNSDKEEVA